MMMSNLKLSERGDTIVEVAIALAIISGVVAALFATSSVAFRLAVSTRQHSDSTIYLQQQLELIQNIRDQLVQASPPLLPDQGWNTFSNSIFGASQPQCGTSFATISVGEANRGNPVGTVAWSIQTASRTIANLDATYSIEVDACYPALPATDKIRFTAVSKWEGPGGIPQTNNAILELVNTGNIQQAVGL